MKSNRQIAALQQEAGQAGDWDLIVLCAIALGTLDQTKWDAESYENQSLAEAIARLGNTDPETARNIVADCIID